MVAGVGHGHPKVLPQRQVLRRRRPHHVPVPMRPTGSNRYAGAGAASADAKFPRVVTGGRRVPTPSVARARPPLHAAFHCETSRNAALAPALLHDALRDGRKALPLLPVAARREGPAAVLAHGRREPRHARRHGPRLAHRPSDAPVVVLGEPGTGKEVLARLIHANGPRRDRPFVVARVAGAPPDAVEAELFGRTRGGADGLFAAAAGGTLFVDEVAELPPAAQGTLLRVLDGGDGRSADVRLVCGTAHDLAARVAEGRFRQDLYYRLRVFALEMPPLRARRETSCRSPGCSWPSGVARRAASRARRRRRSAAIAGPATSGSSRTPCGTAAPSHAARPSTRRPAGERHAPPGAGRSGHAAPARPGRAGSRRARAGRVRRPAGGRRTRPRHRADHALAEAPRARPRRRAAPRAQ